MNNDKITMLTVPDRVRKRISLIFGSADADGAAEAFASLARIFVTEAELGFCTRISVTLHDDRSVSIAADGRALSIDDIPVRGRPAWRHSFCELPTAPREADSDYRLSLGRTHHRLFGAEPSSEDRLSLPNDHSFDLCCVQCASEFMRAESVSGGVRRKIEFRHGLPLGGVTCEPSDAPSGTVIRFRSDPELFGGCSAATESIREFLRKAADSVSGLECRLICETEQTTDTF